MPALLDDPLVRSAFAPFVVALLVGDEIALDLEFEGDKE
jgi:hypothetical protein